MKTFALLAISGISLCAAPVIKAQKAESPWTFGVKAGINSSTFNIGNGSAPNNTDGIIGFNGGVTMEYALRNGFFLTSGLEFTTKGADNETASYLSAAPNSLIYTLSKDSRRLKYLQLPLTVGYRLPLSKDVNVTFNAGGYFAYGISGKGTYETWEVGLNDDGTTSLTSSRYESKKSGDTDYGLLGGVGLEYKRLSFNFNYELGLRTLYTGSASSGMDTGWKNRNAAFTVGYKF